VRLLTVAEHRQSRAHGAIPGRESREAAGDDLSRYRTDRSARSDRKAQRVRAVGGHLMAELTDEPGIPTRGVMTKPTDVHWDGGCRPPYELRRAGGREGPQGSRPREATIADQGEQIRRGVGNIGPEGEHDQHWDIAHSPSQIADHLQ
jgi:hypothetical protein